MKRAQEKVEDQEQGQKQDKDRVRNRVRSGIMAYTEGHRSVDVVDGFSRKGA